jgi:kynureninase
MGSGTHEGAPLAGCSEDIEQLDRADPLGRCREWFELPSGVIYLDGNSLGALPREAPERLNRIAREEWGQDLIRSWNSHDWIGAPARVGSKIARLVGAKDGEVVVGDSTSVNLFKLIIAAVHDQPGRRVILSEPGNFPTDLYMAKGAADLLGLELRTVDRERLAEAITEEVALVLLTHVHYKSAARWNMAAINRRSHEVGALVLWDLSHSAGAVTLDLNGDNADLAVGCGYKYLNGGPGAPAFLFVAERHLDRMRSPLAGWMGHREPFAFQDEYEPAEGIERFLCGTPPIFGLLTLEIGVDILLKAGMQQVEQKSRALSRLFIAEMEAGCAGFGLRLASPRDPAERGSHASFAHPDAYAIVQALIERGLIGDFRAPDIMRFGFAPLYLSFQEVQTAARICREVLASGVWRQSRLRRARVT